MSIRLGKFRVEWDYDPNKNITFCSITDLDDNLIASSSAQLAYQASYDKARVRMVTFNKVLKEISKNNILTPDEVNRLRSEFKRIPNKGVI